MEFAVDTVCAHTFGCCVWRSDVAASQGVTLVHCAKVS